MQTFDNFVIAHPEWKDGYVFPIAENIPIIYRVQLPTTDNPGGLCFAHSAIVGQYYLLARSIPDFKSIIDIPKFLANYQGNNDPGAVMKEILQTKSVWAST